MALVGLAALVSCYAGAESVVVRTPYPIFGSREWTGARPEMTAACKLDAAMLARAGGKLLKHIFTSRTGLDKHADACRTLRSTIICRLHGIHGVILVTRTFRWQVWSRKSLNLYRIYD